MKTIIIEDEPLAAERLAWLLKQYDKSIDIMASLDSVEEAVAWLNTNPSPELIWMDIQLADGQSFEIFDQCVIDAPVIFTTAYDQYALEAFKVYSIDYLLKPIQPQALAQALQKWQRLSRFSPQSLEQIRAAFQPQRRYKSRFLVKVGDKMIFKAIEEIAYFYAEDKTVYLVSQENKRYVIDYTLETLESLLDPELFFRLNRKFLARYEAISEVRHYSNSRLKISLNPRAALEVIISRERVLPFKQWAET
ncbi:LytR/AlgR family response regulator transcription factor [Eisenibacter elegans]|uniref:LytR/AlgR family response regulator transcription factor n=1 Tax=Eisenibacter elegans TaxID=997 RepID=UPI0003FEDD05|nr:LytTR family DNA-binding domain-containing protein [Eisenibacter elegans]